MRTVGTTATPGVAFNLPWPWGGERFEIRDIRPLTYIIGPLGSGKTRLARRLAESLPNAVWHIQAEASHLASERTLADMARILAKMRVPADGA